MHNSNPNSESLSLSVSNSDLNPMSGRRGGSKKYFIFDANTRHKREVSRRTYTTIVGVKYRKDNLFFKIVGTLARDTIVVQECVEMIEEDSEFCSEGKDQRLYKTYHLYYVSNNSIRAVSRNTFKKVKGTIMVKENALVKIVGGKRSDAVTIAAVKRSLLSFHPEGLFSALKKTKSSIRGLGVLGMLTSQINHLVQDGVCTSLTTILLDVTSIILRVSELVAKGAQLSIQSIIGLLVDTFRLVISGGQLKDKFQAESLEALALSSLSMLMPKDMFEIIKRMSLFTSDKILDSHGLRDRFSAYDLMESLLNYVVEFTNWVGNQRLIDFIRPIVDAGKNKVLFFRLKQLTVDAKEARRNPRFLHSPIVREKFVQDLNHIKSSHSMMEWSKRSETVRTYINECEAILKVITSYDKALRVEPSCFVFQGPPGVFKSVLMNTVLKHLDQPVYYHTIKAMQDGKDFYDNYNQEPLFCMDDVGAQGKSQWRTIMNMVSPVKLPLECAEVSLKDTKFFSSELIMVTTNNFTDLHGFTSTDCITEPKALFRRGYVFDFRVQRVGELLNGRILFQYFDTHRERFVDTFPPEIIAYLGGRQLAPELVLTHNDVEQRASIVAWMLDVITVIWNVKKRQRQSNDLPLASVSAKRQFQPESDSVDIVQEALASIFGSEEDDSTEEEEDEFIECDEIRSETPIFEEDYMKYRAAVDRLNNIRRVAPSSPEWDNTFDFGLRNSPRRDGVFKSYLKEFWLSVCEVWNNVSTIASDVFITAIAKATTLFAGGGQGVLEWFKTNGLMYLVMSLVGVIMNVVLFKWVFKKEEVVESKEVLFNAEVEDNLPCTIAAVSRQTMDAEFYYSDAKGKDKKSESACLVSGHCIVTVYHNFVEACGDIYCTVYKDRAQNHRLIDKLKYTLIYKDERSDVAILQCTTKMASPFKNLSKHLKFGAADRDHLIKEGFFVGSAGCVRLNTIKSAKDFPLVYSKGELYTNKVEDGFLYNKHGIGLCGSPMVDSELGITGMHTAGSNLHNLGCAILWPVSVKEKMFEILSKDKSFLLDIPVSEKTIPDFSGIKLQEKLHLSTPTKNSIKPTALHGIYPTTKEPSNMLFDRQHTVKTIGKKSFSPLKDVPLSELSFAKDVLESIIEPYTDLSEREVVLGNIYLAPLNKDSSNGFNCDPDKDVYVDFKNGELTTRCRQETRALEEKIERGEVDYKDWLWVETLKEETRDVSKGGEPRSFRVGRIHSQVLQKMLSGHMVANIMRQRDYSGIALGINPIKEWPKYYQRLKQCSGRHWASDISRWDGAMLAQVQCLVNEVMVERYCGGHKVLLEFMLSSMTNCLVGMNDDLFLTTHSMPSGSFLTAVYNSLVNKVYTAMWYKRYARNPTVTSFFTDLFDIVLGDDKVIGTIKHEDNLNALTMMEFFDSIGLKCTTSKKLPVTQPYDNLDDITFLKRTFRYHPTLDQVVCPLDIRTIQSTIQWYNTKQDYNDVLRDKLHCFQREMYLHYDSYNKEVDYVESVCLSKGIMFVRLPEHYIRTLYLKEPDVWKFSSFSNLMYI